MTFYNIPSFEQVGGAGSVGSLYSEQSLTAGLSTNFPISESLNGWKYCSVSITINEDGEAEVNAFSLKIMNLSTGVVIITTEQYANENTFVEYDDFSVSILSGTLNLGVQSHGSGQTLTLRLGNVLIF